MNLTRGERFKDARIVHNQHGKQTMDEVAAATGIKKSLIQALENDDNDRDVGYTKVATLAAHYRVTADFLLGLTNDPNPRRTAIDDLGLSPQVIEWLIELRDEHGTHGIADDIFSNEAFHLLVDNLCDYYNSLIAEYIYDDIFVKHFPKYDDSNATQAELEALYDDIGQDETHKLFERSVTDYLYSQRLIWNRNEDSFALASAMTQGEGLTISNIAEYKVSKRLTSVLEGISYYAKQRYTETIDSDKSTKT